jgi:ABC-type transport system involved in Fe-S cluster assembly fused permease/ATPase subunit
LNNVRLSEALEAALANRTSFAIAHRLSTVQGENPSPMMQG